MRVRGFLVYALCYLCFCGLALLGAGAALGAPGSRAETLQVYTATVTPAELATLIGQGYDVVRQERNGNAVAVELILWDSQAARLRSQGFVLTPKPSPAQPSRQQGGGQFGWTVWRSFDEPGGFEDQINQLAQANPNLVKLVLLGRSQQGRPILALKLTENARELADGSRPGIYYQSGQHAREWIAPEVNRRFVNYLIDKYRAGDAEISALLRTRELWFVLVMNPDGYEYTFTDERLWRKNLRDNDNDDAISIVDGVDLNRNWPGDKWGWDNEGSSDQLVSLTYRGPTPGSEPEVQAIVGLLQRAKPEFMIDYHSYIPGILYPFGWQLDQPSADDPLFRALAGDTRQPAIEGYVSIRSSELYTTNGTADDYAYEKEDVLAFTVEMGEGTPGSGFEFPDDPALVQAEFEKNLPFALDLAQSAPDPAQPRSHLGNTVEPFYLDTFAESYGSPQVVRVTALRKLGKLVLKYQINNGPVQTRQTSVFKGGERNTEVGDVYYQVRQGTVRGPNPGDRVRVWFETRDGTQKSEAFTYRVKQDTNARILVVAAEDYTGISPVQTVTAPRYAQLYAEALRQNRFKVDIYDVDANGRQAPDALGVLSHYALVVWETGDDIITRDPGQVPGTASRLANDLQIEMRQYLDEGGKLIFAGKYAGLQYSQNLYIYDPETNTPDPSCNPFAFQPNCKFLSDDFLQYYFGAYIYNSDAGTTEEGGIYTVKGTREPYDYEENEIVIEFAPQISVAPTHTASFLPTSAFLPEDDFPQFASYEAAVYVRPGGPFDPHTGDQYVYSQIADQAYKRLTRTIDLTGKITGELTFWVSYDLEQDWDYFFVEAHTVGQDDWTTLPDQNGHTITDTGLSCVQIPLVALHPWVGRYQTYVEAPDAEPSCSPTGTTGAWNAATGRSAGWEQWQIDLSAYAGQQVEISLAYVSDPAVQGLGVFLDDVVISTGEATSFEGGLDGWTATGPPEGSPPNPNNFELLQRGEFPEGAIIVTEDTFYFGFGLEDVADPNDRRRLLGRAARQLLGFE
jgi:hypothetical protein